MKFQDELAALVSREMAGGSAQRQVDAVEALARALGFSIAIAAKGDGKMIDVMMTGAESYAHAEAAEKAPFGKLMSALKARP